MKDALTLLGLMWGVILLALPGAVGFAAAAWWVFELGWSLWLSNVVVLAGFVLLLPVYAVAVFVPILRRFDP